MQRQERQQQEAQSGMPERSKTDPLNLTPQRVGFVPFQSDDTSEDDSTSAAPDDTSEDDSTSAAPDDTSEDDSTSASPPLLSARQLEAKQRPELCSLQQAMVFVERRAATLEATTQPSGMRWPGSGAAPPLLSAGETTAGTTLPSVSVPPIVGSKAREQRVSDVTAKVDAGRMQKSGDKRVSWSRTELLKLMQAVDRHGRDWVSVSRDVGSKTRQQCINKICMEVAAGRMQEPGGKREQESRSPWSQAELVQLKAAVDRHGRDWVAVSRDVGSKTKQQCLNKVILEVAAGRMEEPGGKQEQESWSQDELIKLKAAVDRHGRDWVSVSRYVGSRNRQQCKRKVISEVAAGRMQEPDGKREQESWSQAELIQLKAAVDRHGRDWAAVSRDVGSKTDQQCLRKVKFEVAAGRMQEPGGKQEQESWSQDELIKLKAAVDRHGRDWVSVSRDVGSKTRQQCINKVKIEVAAGRMQEPGGKQERESWSQAELIQLKAAVDRHGRDWAAVSRDVGSKTRLQCFKKVKQEVGAGRMQEPGGKQERESWSQAELVQLKAAVDRHGRDWAAVTRDVGSKTKKQCLNKVEKEVAAGRME
jgi:hypothetical protein